MIWPEEFATRSTKLALYSLFLSVRIVCDVEPTVNTVELPVPLRLAYSSNRYVLLVESPFIVSVRLVADDVDVYRNTSAGAMPLPYVEPLSLTYEFALNATSTEDVV